MSRKRNDKAYDSVFYMACNFAQMNDLKNLLQEEKFHANRLLSQGPEYPLTRAVQMKNNIVAKMLLDHGANPNIQNGEPLYQAFTFKEFAMAELLLKHGAKLTSKSMVKAIHLIVNTHNSGELVTCASLLIEATEKLDSPHVDKVMLILEYYANLCLAIINFDKTRIAQIIKDSQKTEMKVRYNGINLSFDSGRLKITGKSKRCFGKFSVDYDALRIACRFQKLEVVKFLVREYGLKLDRFNSFGQSPLYEVQDTDFGIALLTLCPEININRVPIGVNGLRRHQYNCTVYATFLELGARRDDKKSYRLWDDKHSCLYKEDYQSFGKCKVIHYLHKLRLIDFNFVDQILTEWDCPLTLDIHLEGLDKDTCENEIKKMENINISQGTTYTSPKCLYDVIFFEANEAARYSWNEVFHKLYEENEQDFRKAFPHYGFILNYKLRRGQVRRERLESALEFLCSAMGTGMPVAFAELIFGYFNNPDLDSFTCDSMTNDK